MKFSDFPSWREAFLWLGGSIRRCPDDPLLLPLVHNCPPPPPAPSPPTPPLSPSPPLPRPPPSSPDRDPVEACAFAVYDTETTGLANYDVAIQVAVGFFAMDGTELGWYDKLWKLPDGVHINPRAEAVHKISRRLLDEKGVTAAPELERLRAVFARLRERGVRIVAHNATFDERILVQTARAHGVGGWQLDSCFCTMKASKAMLQIRMNNSKAYKNPKNSELYEFFFGAPPAGRLHDAKADVRVTAKCFVAGTRRGWWAL